MLSGLLDYLESDQRAPLQRYSKYSELDAKNGTSLHEYFNLSVLTGRYRRGVESKVLPKEWLCYQLSILDQNLLVSELLFVKFRIFKQLTRCQFDKMIETLRIHLSIQKMQHRVSHPEINSVHHKLPLCPFLKVCKIFWWAL